MTASNPTAQPGSGAIPPSIILVNLAIQIIGEVFVTDFLVA